MLVLIAACSFATIMLSIMAVAWRPPNPVRARARALSEGTLDPAPSAYQPFTGRVMLPMGRGFLNTLAGILPHRWLRRLDRMLVMAGEPIDLGSFVLLWVLIAISACVFGILLLPPLPAALIGAVGVLGPYLWLRRKVRTRQRKITNALPDAIDLLVACVEAGLGLDASLIRVAEATEGPLGDEIDLTLREIAMGQPRQEALLELGTRAGVSDLDGFIRPVVQAERLGVSIGDALRVQAQYMRIRRRQRAQDAAQKMPVKLTIPICLFFVPATLLAAATPVVYTWIKLLALL
jgi:tight adherence protein C